MAIVVASGALAPAQAIAAAPKPQFVTASGTELRYNGAPYRFTGLNIYNANSTGSCWYDMVSGTTLSDSLNEISGSSEVFRAWFFQSFATVGGVRSWTAFDHTLAAAKAHGLKVVVTLSNQWGDCESSGYRNETWYKGGYLRREPGGTTSYFEFVRQVVKRYAKDPTILAWQLVNEAEVKPARDGPCSAKAAKILKAFAKDVSTAIKAIDRNHLVSLGTIGGGQCGTQGAEYQDVMSVRTIDLCEFHDYDFAATMPGDIYNGLQVRLNQCAALSKPLFVGEVGIRPSDVGGTLAARASQLEGKLSAQFAAGIVGALAWAWDKDGSTLTDFDIGPGDPALLVLAAH
jgi:endo-1,4-beta-mannosidase